MIKDEDKRTFLEVVSENFKIIRELGLTADEIAGRLGLLPVEELQPKGTWNESDLVPNPKNETTRNPCPLHPDQLQPKPGVHDYVRAANAVATGTCAVCPVWQQLFHGGGRLPQCEFCVHAL